MTQQSSFWDSSKGFAATATSLTASGSTINTQILNIKFMNKAELVVTVQKLLGKDVSKASAEKAVNAVIESIRTGIKKKKSVQLIGFGTFKVANRKARLGINPKTGAQIKIKASKTVRFVCGKALKASL